MCLYCPACAEHETLEAAVEGQPAARWSSCLSPVCAAPALLLHHAPALLPCVLNRRLPASPACSPHCHCRTPTSCSAGCWTCCRARCWRGRRAAWPAPASESQRPPTRPPATSALRWAPLTAADAASAAGLLELRALGACMLICAWLLCGQAKQPAPAAAELPSTQHPPKRLLLAVCLLAPSITLAGCRCSTSWPAGSAAPPAEWWKSTCTSHWSCRKLR